MVQKSNQLENLFVFFELHSECAPDRKLVNQAQKKKSDLFLLSTDRFLFFVFVFCVRSFNGNSVTGPARTAKTPKRKSDLFLQSARLVLYVYPFPFSETLVTCLPVSEQDGKKKGDGHRPPKTSHLFTKKLARIYFYVGRVRPQNLSLPQRQQIRGVFTKKLIIVFSKKFLNHSVA